MIFPKRSHLTSCGLVLLLVNALLSLETIRGADQDAQLASRWKVLAEGVRASWAPEGDRLVFGKMPFGSGLRIFDIKTEVTTDLINKGKAPAWCPRPDGPIAFMTGDKAAEQAIWFVEPDGKNAREVARGGFPHWSSDGKTLYYHARKDGQVMALDWLKREAVPKPLLIVRTTQYPVVSPDGSRVAVQRGSVLQIVDISTGRSILDWPLAGHDVVFGNWSPDGKQFGFGTYSSSGTWLLDIQAKTARRVAPNRCMFPAWSPDMKRIVLDRRSFRHELLMATTEGLRSIAPVTMVEAESLALKEELKRQIKKVGKDHWTVTDLRWKIRNLQHRQELSPDEREEFDQMIKMSNQARQFYQRGEYSKAVSLGEQVRETVLRLRGDKHPSYATSLDTLATYYRSTGDYAKAELLLTQAVAVNKKTLGETHPFYGTSLHNLAVLCKATGKLTAAVSFSKQAMQIYKESLGEKHPHYADSLSTLADSYSSIGEYRKAEPLLKQAAEINQNPWGDQLSYASNLNSLGLLYIAMGEYSKAEPTLTQVARILKEVLGEKHPDYATGLNSLGLLYEATGEYTKAEVLFEKAVDISQKTVGEEHPDHATALSNLADLYRTMGKFSKAEELFRGAMEIHKATVGENSLNYASSLNGLAVVYHLMGKHSKAEPMFQRAAKISKVAVGEKHPSYATIVNNLADLYHAMGRYTEAESLLKETLLIYKESLGEKHPVYADGLTDLANLYEAMGEYAQAEPLLKQSLQIYVEVLGDKHPDYARVLSGYASLSKAMGEYSQAESLYKKALQIQKEVLGNKHPNFAAILHNLADLYVSLGENALAEPLFKEAMNICGEVQGKEHPAYATILNNAGIAYKARGDYVQAEMHFKEALEIRKAVLGEKHPHISLTLTNLAMLCDAMWDHAQAEPLYREALKNLADSLGERHDYYLYNLNNLAHMYETMGKYSKAEPLFREALRQKLDLVRLTIRGQSEAAARSFLRSQFVEPGPLLTIARQLPEQNLESVYDLVFSVRGLTTEMLAERRPIELSSANGQELYRQLRQTSKQLAQLTLATVPPEQQEHRHKWLQELNDQKENLERQLAAQSREFRQEQAIETATPMDLTRLLPPEVAVVDLMEVWISHPPKNRSEKRKWTREYEAFILRKADTEVGYSVDWVHLGSAKEINDAVIQWLRQIEQEQGLANSPDHPAQFLRTRLWDKLQPHLNRISHVVILPDSQLCFLPWAALPGKKPGTFLLEDITLSTALNGQELYRQLITSPEEKAGLLLVGGVDYDHRTQHPTPSSKPEPALLATAECPAIRRSPAVVDPGKRPRWPFLPGTEQETKTLHTLWSNSETAALLTKTAANEAALQTAMPQAKYLHLATHGFFADAKFRSAFQHDPNKEHLFANPGMELLSQGRATVTGRNPLILSGVVLAGANLPPVKDELGLPTGEDGILTAQEVVHLDLRGTELVTLSACDTGRGTEVAGGEGIYGLQRAFHLAGAKHVVASLWKVDDQATAALMKLFYHHLWKDNQHPAKALRNAQLTLLRHPEEISKLAGADPKQLGELAGSLRALDLSASVKLPKGEKPKPATKRTPIRLWAAFTHSGPPDPTLAP